VDLLANATGAVSHMQHCLYNCTFLKKSCLHLISFSNVHISGYMTIIKCCLSWGGNCRASFRSYISCSPIYGLVYPILSLSVACVLLRLPRLRRSEICFHSLYAFMDLALNLKSARIDLCCHAYGVDGISIGTRIY
jgi:hypothetical protein